ncbi:MAG: Eco57I restriction-modification methylase domain-containing protein [Ignavibacteriales bacterium]|nr:Eco57I restriction-modification methylase domain-containing protein [Ignavibacteriales bacterium]
MKPAGVTNYAQLHAQWLEVLDVNILNKKFFQELANWYFWAMDKVQFPDDIEKKKDVRNATNLIRLITRVIFIWFIKEKHLVPASLFNEKYLEDILKDFQKNKKSCNYYQAILQNLFFGTLNQKMDERDFAEDHNRTNKLDQGIKNKYRYPDKFNISKKEIIDLFKDIPFLNGGLFDCLDKFDEEKLEKGKKEQIFVDGFTRLDGKQAIVPDYLFFGEEVEVDLTEYYDPEAKKPIIKKVNGLFHILNSFKFTVAENTPIEEEIALDPELLGKVFENLLASYNPETKTTARKQTGSFYTLREIVNYMVDESLIEYLKSVVSIPAHELNQKQDAFETFETFFNPHNEIQVHIGNLPHWQQENVWYFVTFRLADSIPAEVAEQIKAEREIWLKNNKKNEKGEYTKEQIKEYYHLFSDRIEQLLNNGRGSCVLKNPDISKIVADALNHFNNQRYVLDEWVIMPNHVHILFKPLGENKLPDILHSWKSFTANEINKVTGNKGQLWMHESYDHIVGNENALHAIRNYIRQNPVKANLKEGEYLLSRSRDASDTLTKSRDASGTFEARLRDLFSYNDEGNPLNSKETDELIEAINNAKILDPACGSGAFPMGVLHKMVHLLQKLDPGNVKWKAQQKEKIIGNQIKELEKDKKAIAGLSDKAVREKAIQAVDERLKEIDEIFESKNNFDDYARKLYLIENCIYGIDIQPIAVQISKLRFFISLIIDQKVHPSSLMDENKNPASLLDGKPKENRGIRPLPNLETKFVAANTLISLEIPTTDLFSENNPIKLLQEQLKATRHEYFNAKTRKDKLHLQQQDKELRKKIAAQISDTLINKKQEEIKSLEKQLSDAKKKLVQIETGPEQKESFESTNIFGETETTVIDKKKEKIKAQKSTISFIEKQINSMKAADNKDAIQKVAQQISSFDPYDQNHFANWFEPEWMFGLVPQNGDTGVFDIVIGNPPYIRKTQLNDVFKKYIDDHYFSAYKQYDIYIFFNEFSLNILKVNGVFTFIQPNKFLSAEYGNKLCCLLKNNTTILLIWNVSLDGVFEASVYPYVYLFKKKSINNKITSKTFNLLEYAVKLIGFDNFKTSYSIINKIQSKSILIKEVAKTIKRGLANTKVNFYDRGKYSGIKSTQINKAYIKPIANTKFNYVVKSEEKAKEIEFSKKLFLLPRTVLKIRATYKDKTDHILDRIYYFENNNMNYDDDFILGILNSKLTTYYYEQLYGSTKIGGGYIDLKGNQIENLPIPKISKHEQQSISLIVKEIIKKPNANSSKLEKQIDDLVYKLYDLTEEEIKIIEGNE